MRCRSEEGREWEKEKEEKEEKKKKEIQTKESVSLRLSNDQPSLGG